MALRIVLDTNVVVSALLWRGTPFRLLSAMRAHAECELFTSPALLSELSAVLARPDLAARLASIRRSTREVVADYGAVAQIVTPLTVPRVVKDDPDDDEVIAAAVTAKARLVISGDRHLLALQRHGDFVIRRPADVLGWMEGQFDA